MADNKKKRGGSDRGLIAISEPYEVRYWSKKFKVTPAVLKAAVKNVGRSSAKVAIYIKMKKAKKRDRGLIALSQAYEVHHWAKAFKTTPAKLKEAVKAVGRSTKKVAAYFSAAKKKKTKAKRKAKKKK